MLWRWKWHALVAFSIFLIALLLDSATMAAFGQSVSKENITYVLKLGSGRKELRRLVLTLVLTVPPPSSLLSLLPPPALFLSTPSPPLAHRPTSLRWLATLTSTSPRRELSPTRLALATSNSTVRTPRTPQSSR